MVLLPMLVTLAVACVAEAEAIGMVAEAEDGPTFLMIARRFDDVADPANPGETAVETA